MKVVLSILIWVIIGLVLILAIKSLVNTIKEKKANKKSKNKEQVNINKEEDKKGE